VGVLNQGTENEGSNVGANLIYSFTKTGFPRLGKSVVPLIILLLSSCASNNSSQPSIEQSRDFLLEEGIIYGQTFVSEFDGLTGIKIYLSPDLQSNADGEIRVVIQADVDSATVLGERVLPINQIDQPAFYNFRFKPITDSNQEYLYYSLSIEGDGRVFVNTLPGEAYIHGSFYVRSSAIEAQSRFELSYHPLISLLGLVGEFIKWSGILLIGITIFVIPGFALIHLLFPGLKPFGLLTGIVVSVGVSLSIYPLLLLWTDFFNLHLGAFYAWGPVLIGSGILVWKAKEINWREQIEKINVKEWPITGFTAIVILAGLITIFMIRFIAVRSIEIPMWGDSVQHTMIAQLILDHRGLFNQWSPYAELQSFTYHFGFHSDVAAFSWLTGRSAIRSTLWTGQILNGMAAFALFPLAKKISRNTYAAIAAVFIAGVLSPFPNFYTNWGRYTQLAGLVILPIVIYVSWMYLERENRASKYRPLIWLLMGGLALTHYRVFIFAFLFFPAYFLFSIRSKNLKQIGQKSIYLGVGTFVLFIPWLVRLLDGELIKITSRFIGTPAVQTPEHLIQYNAIGKLANFAPLWLWLVAMLILLWSTLKRKRPILIVALWWAMIILTANPGTFGLPGTGAISNFAVFISSYFPLSIAFGLTVAEIHSRVERDTFNRLIMAALFVAITLGSPNRISEISSDDFSLVTKPDLLASAWLAENIEVDSLILVNSFFAYGDTLVVGSDAGWWLPLLAGRNTTLPPITYGSEIGPIPNYLQDINDRTNEILQMLSPESDLVNSLRQYGISHVYIGQRQGRLNYFGPNNLDPSRFDSDPEFTQIYHRDHVRIYALSE
jgi:hypothetical protein